VSTTSGPYSPVAGVVINAVSPIQGSGNVISAYAVVKNISPYLLQVASETGSTLALIDPYTTDIVALSPASSQAIAITPVTIGLVPPQTASSLIFVTWYQNAEPPPSGNYPYAVPLSNQIEIGGLSHAYATLNASSGNPVELLAPPPAGYANRLQRWACYCNFGGTGSTASATIYFWQNIVTGGLGTISGATFGVNLSTFGENLNGQLATLELEVTLANSINLPNGWTVAIDLWYDVVQI
jgi:hypothetical protein